MKCFVTKYAASVNAKLEKYKGIRIKVKNVNNAVNKYFVVNYPDDGVHRSADILSDEGYFMDEAGNNLGTSIDLEASNKIIASDGSEFDITQGVTGFAFESISNYGVDIDTFKNAKTNILINNYSCAYGDLSSLSNLTNLTAIGLAGTKVTGDLSSLSNLTNLTELYLSESKITGDLSSLSNFTNLKILYLSESNVTGDLSSLSNLTNLKILYLGTKVTGDLSSLSNLTNLTAIGLEGTKVTGDLSTFATEMAKKKIAHTLKVYASNSKITNGTETITSAKVITFKKDGTYTIE